MESSNAAGGGGRIGGWHRTARTATFFQRGIFGSERTAWIALVVYTILLYSTLTLTNYLYRATFDWLGKSTVSQGIYTTAALIALALLVFVWLRLPRTPSACATLGIIGLLTYYTMSLEYIPANRIHFFQYCPLAILGLEALRFRVRDRNVYLWTFLLVSLIGIGDEFLQGLLPGRHFDTKDVVVNALAVLLALAFVGFVVREENYPWGKREG